MTVEMYMQRIAAATQKEQLVWLRRDLGGQIGNGDLSIAAGEIIDNAINCRWDELFPRNRYSDGLVPDYAAIAKIDPDKDHQRNTHTSKTTLFPKRKHIASPDREKSRLRRRTLGLSRAMPDQMANDYLESFRAVAAVLAEQHIRFGKCTLSIDEIAARAGVCPTTVRNYRRRASERGEIGSFERKVRGKPNDTNIVRILSTEWRRWLKKRAEILTRIACNGFTSLQSTKGRFLNPSKYSRGANSEDKRFSSSDPPPCREALSGAPS